MLTVREFVEQSYQLINAASPTVPLHGSDLSLGIRILNQLLHSYASTGLMITVARTESVALTVGQDFVVCGSPDFVPTPDITAGRLINLENAWINFSNVDIPLINISIDEFESSVKYRPLDGLPRFIIFYPDVAVTRLRLYPAPSQFFEFSVRGKFELPTVTSNDDMGILPEYYQQYLMFALARQLAPFKGRMAAWVSNLENIYQELRDIMISTSEVNVAISGDRQSLLNGSWRVRSGV